MEDKTYSETITPRNESFLSKYFGLNREWLIKVKIAGEDEDLILNTTWKTDMEADTLWSEARKAGLTDELLEEDKTYMDGTTLLDLGEENLVYTESTGHVTYTQSDGYTPELENFIRNTYSGEDLDYALERLYEAIENYIEE